MVHRRKKCEALGLGLVSAYSNRGLNGFLSVHRSAGVLHWRRLGRQRSLQSRHSRMDGVQVITHLPEEIVRQLSKV